MVAQVGHCRERTVVGAGQLQVGYFLDVALQQLGGQRFVVDDSTSQCHISHSVDLLFDGDV